MINYREFRTLSLSKNFTSSTIFSVKLPVYRVVMSHYNQALLYSLSDMEQVLVLLQAQ